MAAFRELPEGAFEPEGEPLFSLTFNLFEGGEISLVTKGNENAAPTIDNALAMAFGFTVSKLISGLIQNEGMAEIYELVMEQKNHEHGEDDG